MSRDRLIVLKFGGSVLRDESTLRLAVHEIYRWRRNGWRVIAVVSALAERTDELLREAERACAGADGHAVAALVATGELHSAGLLGLHLDRAGVPAAVLWPASFGLVAEGHPLDADPVSLRQGALGEALARYGVVVVPGYAAHDHEGRPVVLGRGGSDLTALFLAQRLGARKCRLIKDVDGLYDRDPIGPGARRFATATFEDALATDGTIVQHKAVRFAQRCGLTFELGRINGVRPTWIGATRTRFAAAERQRRLKVALLGLGTVGGGVYELLVQMPDQFEVTAVAVRDPSRPRPELCRDLASGGVRNGAPALSGDAIAAAAGGADVVVEAIGGCDVAARAVRAAIEAGAHVVTANKSLIAERGRELRALAHPHAITGGSPRRRPRLLYSAAVGGSMPLLERLSAYRKCPGNSASPGASGICCVRGVLNGTTNFILDRVAEGLSFAQALSLAQEHGYAEPDPSRDLRGLDAADKLCLIARRLGAQLDPEDVDRDELTDKAIASASALGSRNGGPLRHVAILGFSGGRARGEVRLLQVSPQDPLARARDAGNVAVLERADGSVEVLQGKGAGRWPTAEAVVADLLWIQRRTNLSKGALGQRGRRGVPETGLGHCNGSSGQRRAAYTSALAPLRAT